MDKYVPWLEEFHVTRPSPITGLADKFERALASAAREEDIQKFLAENPFVLSEQLPHCHYVVPKFRFGGQFVSDFILPEMTSGGTIWTLIEFEPVDAQLVTVSGQLADRARIGIQQIRDWRDWLLDNRDVAIRSRARNGLGLNDLTGVWGWLVIGRRSQITPRFNQLRKQVLDDSNIEIMTYDRILERFRARAEYWEAWDGNLRSE